MSARPWFKFYTADWRADTALRSCSAGARGLWLEMITLMDEADPRGHLALKGRAMSTKQLAMLAAIPIAEVERSLIELEEAGVFSRTADGTIISRKMVRETRVSGEQSRRARGGEETPPENTDLFGSGLQSGSAETHAQSPESRVQKPEPRVRTRAQKGARDGIPIPEGFPDEQAITEAAGKFQEARVDVNAGREALKFRAHAETKARLAKDWDAAWRTWVIHAIEYAERDGKVIALADYTPDPEWTARKYRTWMDEWLKNRHAWKAWERGPPPDEPGCKIPPEIMAEFGHTPVRRAEG